MQKVVLDERERATAETAEKLMIEYSKYSGGKLPPPEVQNFIINRLIQAVKHKRVDYAEE